MIELIKNAFKNKKFYISGFKKVSRMRTVAFIMLLSIAYSLILTPINTYYSFKDFNSFREEINNLPQALEVNFNNGKLQANFKKPVEIKINDSSFLVIDPANSFNTYQKDKSYLVFKEKGFVITNNNEKSNQQYVDGLNVGFTSKGLANNIKAISNEDLWLVFGSLYLLTNILSMLGEIIFTSLFFGSIYYMISRLFKETNKITLLQSIKRILFLSIYLVLGYVLNFLTEGVFPLLPLVVFIIAYTILISRNRNV